MKITDIKKSDLPLRVKLTEGFTLEESFDPGMIVQINNYKEDWDSEEGVVYEVSTSALLQDFTHNNAVDKKDWYDKDGVPCLTIFDIMQENPGTEDFNTYIYVMENDDAFELVPEKKGYILETLNSIDENGDQCRIQFKISEETKNVLNVLSSSKVEGSGVEYIITDLKFSIIDENI